jgi:OPA family glycerol-3-phosphate transporter-like MFS transporter
VIWSVNAYFQSFGSISVVKINSRWFSNEDRGKFVGLFGFMIQSGRILANILPPILVAVLLWRYAFWVPAGLVLLAIPFTCLLVKNNPEDFGHTSPITVAHSDRPFWQQGLFWTAIALALAVGFTRNSVDHFYTSHFVRAYGVPFKELRSFPPYLLVSTWMPWAACLGVFFMGTLSDRLRTRWGVLALAGVGVIACLALARFWGPSGAYPLAFSLIGYAAFIQAMHSLLNGAISVELAGAEQSGRVVGYLDGTEYLGGFVATPIAANMVGDLARWTLAPLTSASIALTLVGLAALLVRLRSAPRSELNAQTA